MEGYQFFDFFATKKYRLFTGDYFASSPHTLLENVGQGDRANTKEEKKNFGCIEEIRLFRKEKRETIGKKEAFSGWNYPPTFNPN